MNSSHPPFAAALLAGGRSSRMGRDKALLEWQGAPLWRVQLGKLMELNPDRLLLSCREEQALKNVFAEPVFDLPDHSGPLDAIARCLETARLPLLVLAVDMPRMTPAFLRNMITQCGDGSHGLIGRGTHGFEPLAAIYPPVALPLMHAALERGELRMQDVAARLAAAGCVTIRDLKPEEVPLFFNVNTPEDYAWTNPAPPASI